VTSILPDCPQPPLSRYLDQLFQNWLRNAPQEIKEKKKKNPTFSFSQSSRVFPRFAPLLFFSLFAVNICSPTAWRCHLCPVKRRDPSAHVIVHSLE